MVRAFEYKRKKIEKKRRKTTTTDISSLYAAPRRKICISARSQRSHNVCNSLIYATWWIMKKMWFDAANNYDWKVEEWMIVIGNLIDYPWIDSFLGGNVTITKLQSFMGKVKLRSFTRCCRYQLWLVDDCYVVKEKMSQ